MMRAGKGYMTRIATSDVTYLTKRNAAQKLVQQARKSKVKKKPAVSK